MADGVDVAAPSDYPSENRRAGDRRQPIYILLPTRTEALRTWVAGLRRLDPMLWVLLLVVGAVLAAIIVAAHHDFSFSNPILCLILVFLLPVFFAVGVLKLQVIMKWVGHPRTGAAVRPIQEWMARKRQLRAVMSMEPRPPLKVIMEAGAALDELEHFEFAEHLAKAGYTGDVVVIARGVRAPFAPICPLAVPFEPMPLDGSTANDFALVGTTVRQDRDSGLHCSTAPKTIIQRFRRAWGLGGLHWPLLVLLLAMGEIVYRRGSFSCGTLLFGAVAFAVIVARLARLEPTAVAYIIPGGLINVQSKRIYRPSAGIMIWRAESRQLHVTDVNHKDAWSVQVTREEAVLAVRAWLSPVPSPSDELIESFLQGRS